MATTAAATTRRPTSPAAGPDRLTVLMLALAALLTVLALLAWQMRSSPAPRAHRMIVLRRVYETRVIETRVGARGASSSFTQSVSSSAPASSIPSAPVSRSS